MSTYTPDTPRMKQISFLEGDFGIKGKCHSVLATPIEIYERGFLNLRWAFKCGNVRK